LGQGIAALHVACEGALSACDSAKAVLTERAAMSDSAFQQERRRSTVNFNLATDATGAAVKWHVVADSYRRQRNISLILNGILVVIAAVK
jgi:hypothetical protein